MILVCFDGSPDARAAIDRAGRLMPGSEATVLVLWETVLETMTPSGSPGMILRAAADVDADLPSGELAEHRRHWAERAEMTAGAA